MDTPGIFAHLDGEGLLKIIHTLRGNAEGEKEAKGVLTN